MESKDVDVKDVLNKENKESNRKEKKEEQSREEEKKKIVDGKAHPVVLGIKGMTTNTKEGHLREIFGNYGVVKRVKVERRDGTAISQGIGFVELGCEEDANRAIEYLDGSQIDGVRVYVYKVYRSPFALEDTTESKKDRHSSRSRSRSRHHHNHSHSHRHHSH
ncbi:hypothetical protein WA588_005795, partial [Blastocystis sp. NMH]